jgi:hypothetical protein
MNGSARLRQKYSQSMNRRYSKLLADLSCKPVVYFTMTRHWHIRTVERIRIDRVAATLSLYAASLALQMTDEFVPFHTREVPTWTDKGTASIRSASCEGVTGLGIGNGRPASSNSSARSSIAFAIMSRASGKSKPCDTAPGKSSASATTIWPAVRGRWNATWYRSMPP